MYPNPAGRGNDWHVQYFLTDAVDVQIGLYDVVGKSIFASTHSFTAGMNEITVPTADLSAGTYYVRVVSTKGVFTRKVLLIR